MKKYFRVKDVDKERLSELVVKAKGPSRSVRAFAEEVGVNPSTLTRIINMQNKSYSNDSLIVSIAEHADPDSNVTLEMLMDAHGVKEWTAAAGLEYRVLSEKRMRQIIFDELITRGYSVQNVSIDAHIGRFIYDMVLETNALGKLNKWAFEFKVVTGIVSNSVHLSNWISRVMECFYVNKGEVKRISLVVENKDIFERLKKMLSDCIIPDEFSILYVGRNQILEEYVVQKTDGEPVIVFAT